MHKITFTDYYTGKTIKTLTVKTYSGITFGPEEIRGEERFIVRDYSTGKVVRSCAMPQGSCRYSAN